jgi:putative peptidoglycan lipid II flippase
MRRKSPKPSQTVAAMIAATVFAKALGLLRSALLAMTLGDLPEAAAFAAASKIPSAFFDLFFSAALTGAFIPAYSGARAENKEKAHRFSRAFMGAAIICASVFSLAGIIFSPQLISICAPNMGGETYALAAALLRIMFPAAVFTAGAYTLTGLLQARGAFILPAAVSLISNAFTAGYIFFSRGAFSVYALAAVYVFSWFLQMLTLALPLIFRGEFPLPKIDFGNEHLKKALASMPKITAGAWFAPASVLAAAFFCSFVSEKAFVIYDYAGGIYSVAAGVAIYGVGNFCFPALARAFAEKDMELFGAKLGSALYSALAVAVPVFCALIALAPEGVALLYARGNFTGEAAGACALALRTLAFAVPAYANSEVLYRGFCAAEKPRICALSALFSLAVLAAANIFSLILGGGLFGVCASFASAEWAHALFLLFAAKKNFAHFSAFRPLLLAPGGALCLAAMLSAGRFFPLFSAFAPSISNFLKITIVFTCGVVVYLLYIFVCVKVFARKHAVKRKVR